MFRTVEGKVVNSLARWDGIQWSAVDTANGLYRGLMAASDTNLYATDASTIAEWDGTTWRSLISATGLNASVYALAWSGTQLYAAGGFTGAGTKTLNHIAKWDDNTWSSLGSGMNGAVSALATSGPDLYAAGSFTTAGGQPANQVAHWNGTNWSALGSGIDGQFRDLAVSDSGLYIAGHTRIQLTNNYQLEKSTRLALGRHHLDQAILNHERSFAGGPISHELAQRAGGLRATPRPLCRWDQQQRPVRDPMRRQHLDGLEFGLGLHRPMGFSQGHFAGGVGHRSCRRDFGLEWEYVRPLCGAANWHHLVEIGHF
jgi:hypothetical protein